MSIDTAPFESTMHALQEELSSIRTSRANPTVVEKVPVQAYDSQLTLQELATITVPEPQTIHIQPWDVTVVKHIERALRENDLHLNPVVDGQTIRIHFPPLTEEQRKIYVKTMQEKVEQARIMIRKAREHILKEYKEQKTSGTLSEDEYFRLEKEVQKTVEHYNERIEHMSEAKEKELLQI